MIKGNEISGTFAEREEQLNALARQEVPAPVVPRPDATKRLAALAMWHELIAAGHVDRVLDKTRAGRKQFHTNAAEDIRAVLGALAAVTKDPPKDQAHIGISIGPMFRGDRTWWGHYRFGGRWNSVRNDAGNRICYASKEAAEAAAKLTLAAEMTK